MEDQRILIDIQINDKSLVVKETTDALKKLRTEKDLLQERQKVLNKQYKDGEITQGKYNKEINHVNKSLTENKQKTKELSTALRGQNKELQLLNTVNNKSAGHYQRLQAQLALNTIKMKGLTKAELDNVKVGGRLQKQTAKINTELKKLDSKIGNSQRNVGKYSSAFNGLAGAMGVTMGAAGIFTILKNAGKIIVDFEKQMSQVEAILKPTNNEIATLNNLAKELGGSTKFTATQVGEAEVELGKLGFTVREVVDLVPGVLDLAAAAGTDLANAATVAGATVRGFGKDASEGQDVVDLMAKSFTTTALNIEKFSTGMANAQVAAKSTGRTIEFTTAALGTLVDTGVDASKAGTDLRAIFTKLAIKGIDLNDAYEMIDKSSNKVATAQKLVGDRAFSSLITLSEQNEKVLELTKTYENSAGAAKEMADIMENNLKGATTRLSSAWEGFILSLDEGDGLFSTATKSVVGLATRILSLATGINSTNDAIEDTVSLTDKLNDNLEQETNRLDWLFETLKKTNPKSEERAKLIEEINRQYGTTLENLDDEGKFLNQIDSQYKSVVGSLREKIALEARSGVIVKLLEQESIQIASIAIQEELLSIARKNGAIQGIKNSEDSIKAQKDNLTAIRANLKIQEQAIQDFVDNKVKITKKSDEELSAEAAAAAAAAAALLIKQKKELEERLTDIELELETEIQLDNNATEAKLNNVNRIVQANIEAYGTISEMEAQAYEDRYKNADDFTKSVLTLFEFFQIDVEKISNEGLKQIIKSTDQILTNIQGTFTENTIAYKIAASTQAAIATALGAIQAFQQASATVPPPFGQILGGIAAATVTAFGVAQITKINKAEDGMLLQGPSHSQGGININVEGGEAVINKRSTAMFLPELSAINEAGKGRSFMANGGIAGQNFASTDITANAASKLQRTQIVRQPVLVYRDIQDINKRIENEVFIENN